MAENQPPKNRVNTTTSFAQFAARLRGLAHANFEGLALELFRLQFEANLSYRTLCESHGLSPNAVKHWSKIPAVPTSAFKELDLSCLPPQQRTHVFHSSGTTGQKPSRHFHNAESLAVYEESVLTAFRENAVKAGPITILSLTPNSSEAPHSSLVHMFETVRRELGAVNSQFFGHVTGDGEWILDSDALATRLDELCKAKEPVCLLGTAFSYVHLLEHLQNHEMRFQLPAGSITMETGGYKSKSRALSRSELHNLICIRLGILRSHIVCEYGMSELSSQAYGKVSSVGCQVTESVSSPALPSTLDTRHSVVFNFARWARAQIISPETGRGVKEGETGLIRVFDLANVYSVMAIQTEDLGIKRGDGFELVGRAAAAEPRGCSLMTAV